MFNLKIAGGAMQACCDGGFCCAILGAIVDAQHDTPTLASALVSSLIHLVFSIRGALSLVGLMAVAPALAIIIFSGFEHGSMLEQNVRDDVRRQAEAFAQIQQQVTSSVQQNLSTLAAVQALEGSSREQQEALMQRVLDRNPEYVNMSYTDTQGIVQASPQLEQETNLSDRSHIQDVLKHGGFAVGKYVVSRFGQEESLAFAHAVADEQGRIIGAVGLVYRLSAYAKIFDQLELPPQTTLNLLDRQGVSLFSYPAGRGEIGISEVGELGLPSASAEGAGLAAIEYPCPGCVALAGRDGTRRYYATRPLYLPGQDTPYLTVMLGIPEERARAPMVATLRRNTLLMAGLVGVALVLVQFFGNIVFGRRLRRLNFVAEQISQGRISADFDLPSDPSEIGRLGRQMQNMANSLVARSHERDLNEKSLHNSLQEKEMLLQEVHHRVKNNVQLILSLVRLQSTQTKSAADGQANFEAFALALEGRLAAMSEVHEMLYADVDVSEIRLDEFIPRVSRLIRSIYGQLDPEFHLEPVALSLEQAVPVGLIFNEFLTNAYKHGISPAAAASAQKPPTAQKPPQILLNRVRSSIQLVVRDYGPGLPPGFDPNTSTGLGYTLVRSLATQLGGTATWTSSATGTMTGGNAGASSGTTATLEFDLG